MDSDQEAGLNITTRTQTSAVSSVSCEKASPLLLMAGPQRSIESRVFPETGQRTYTTHMLTTISTRRIDLLL